MCLSNKYSAFLARETFIEAYDQRKMHNKPRTNKVKLTKLNLMSCKEQFKGGCIALHSERKPRGAWKTTKTVRLEENHSTVDNLSAEPTKISPNSQNAQQITKKNNYLDWKNYKLTLGH